jgi:hypothetical protein
MFAFTLLLKQIRLRTSSALERPSEDVVAGDGATSGHDSLDEGVAAAS